ncbi:MAG: Holliday junction branch migration DNA helicase RuvB [Patescibacteria group bacterium]|nr:Holliday junction branch migration DNA helicase RuvB [Patescibacteria group bacterium]
MQTRVVDPHISEDDELLDQNLRPQSFASYIGQTNTKAAIQIAIASAQQRSAALDHILLFGPPGLGKTTLANIIAKEMGVGFKTTSGPAIERAGDLAAILTNLKDGDILFIDEIHRLSRPIEEVLYTAMEDYALDIIVGKGPSARSIKIDLPKFTLIGATTRAGLLSSPLRDRFGSIFRLDFYDVEDIQAIIKRSAKLLGIILNEECIDVLAHASRRTPRTANRILKRVRDFALVKNGGQITIATVKEALDLMTIDMVGLDEIDRRIITIIINQFNGGPVGLRALAAAISEESQTLEDVYEPYLIQEGYLIRTAQGRLVTDKARMHLGLTQDSPRLFQS